MISRDFAGDIDAMLSSTSVIYITSFRHVLAGRAYFYAARSAAAAATRARSRHEDDATERALQRHDGLRTLPFLSRRPATKNGGRRAPRLYARQQYAARA